MLGSLNQRAIVRAQTLTPDGGGGYTESWDVVATVWARLEPVSGADRTVADKRQSRARHKITVRRANVFAAGQRVEIGTRIFAVRALLDAGPQSPFVTLLSEELP
jgi:SPP1 family predicted phage head-tail adaptor